MADRRRVEPGVDTAEKDPEAGFDDIREHAATRRLQLGRAGAAKRLIGQRPPAIGPAHAHRIRGTKAVDR